MRHYHYLITACTVFALTACTIPSTRVASNKQEMLEDALRLKEDGKVDEAARAMLQISERSSGSERFQYLFEAAQFYLQENELERAENLLQKIQSTSPDSNYAAILSAQISLRNGQTSAAVAQLRKALRLTDTTQSAKGIYWLTVAEVLEIHAEGTNNVNADINVKKSTSAKSKSTSNLPFILHALQARINVEEFLMSAQSLTKNQDAIWRLLSAQSVTTLKTLKTKTKDGSAKAWLDLAVLAKESKGAVPGKNMAAWRTKYPDLVILNQRLLELRGGALEKLRHVALILPTKSAEFGSSGKAVWEGFQAAQKNNHLPYPVKLYETDADPASAISAYASAVEKGAVLGVGPLPRKSLALLAKRRLLAVPTVALNAIEEEKLPVNLYQFGLPITQEAQIVARAAKGKGFTDAIVLKGNSALDARSADAFIKEWTLLQHTVKSELAVQDFVHIEKLPKQSFTSNTMVFLASDFQNALPAIKAMPVNWTVFGTSALNTASPEVADLDKNKKIYFVDVPTLIKTASTMDKVQNVVDSRLYSLGMDVCRLSVLLLNDEIKFNRPLMNGETGKLRIARNGRVERDLPLVSLQEASLAGYRKNDFAGLFGQ